MNWNIFQWWSLKTRVTLATLAIFVIGIWALAFYASGMLREDMQRLLGEQQFSTVSYIAADVNQQLDERLRALEAVAGGVTPAMLGSTAAWQALLEQRPILQSLFNGGTFVAGIDGTAIADVPLSAGRIGVNYMDRDYIADALKEGKSTIGRPVMGRKVLAPIFSMAVPIRDPQGKVIGALSGVTNLGIPGFLDLIKESRYGKTGGYLLIAPQYRLVVTASDKSHIMEALPALGINPVIDRFVQGHEGSAIFVNPLGVEMLASDKGVPVAGWIMSSVLPTAEAFAPIRAMQQRMLIATIFLTLLAGVLTWWMLRRQLSPMLAAVKTLATLSDSDQPLQPLSINRQDEIGQLIGGFNRLLETLAQREEALKESEFRWKFAIEGSGDGAWDWNLQTDEAKYSKRWKEMLGYAEDDILPAHQEWVNRIHPDDQSYVAGAMQAYLDGKTAMYVIEYRLRCKDESYKWILGRGMVVSRSEDGKPLRMVGTHADITERKQMEAALFDSEERYRLIFEMSEDAIFLTHPEDDRTLAANPAACRMFGYSPEEICDIGRAGIMDVTDTRWSSLLAERSRSGRVRSRVRCIKRNGDVFPAENSSIVFHDSKGNLLAAVHIRDTSAQERAYKELRESEMRWQFAVESQGAAMWDWDAGKDELFLSSAAKELFNLPDTDAKRPIADLIARLLDEDRTLVQGQIDDIIVGKTSEWFGECRLSWVGGTPRWVATQGRVMTRAANGQPHRIVSISRDVTQKKRGEAEARRQKELFAHQGRLVLLGELASALAHEINQPLTAITGFAAACARKTAEIPEALELVRAIEEQAMRAGEIAWRMRGFARRQSLGRSALSLHEVIAGVAKWTRMDNAHLDVVIDITGVDSTLPQVHADRVELEQVLVNLVRNGIEAALPNAKEERIAIAACLGEHPGEIEVSVTDWGCGLPATTELDVFQPFTSSKEQGLGLGLTICFSIIEGHGGHLWATPNPAGGTIFHFTLPVAGQTVQAQEEEIPAIPLPQAFPEN